MISVHVISVEMRGVEVRCVLSLYTVVDGMFEEKGLASRKKHRFKKYMTNYKETIPLRLSILLLLRVQRRLGVGLGAAFLLLLSIYTFLSMHVNRMKK